MENVKVYLVEGFGEEFQGFLELKEDRIEFSGINRNIIALTEKTDRFFYYEQISSIECKKKHSNCKLLISTPTDEIKFDGFKGVSFEDMEAFCRDASNRISTFENRFLQAQIQYDHTIEKLKEAGSLKEKGLISEKEYCVLKKNLLSTLN